MKDTILVKIDVTKIDKNKIIPRTYKNKEGVEVTAKELEIAIIPCKEERFLKQGNSTAGSWKLLKTHFAAMSQTPEEKARGEKSVILGDGLVFRTGEVPEEFRGAQNDINGEAIPF